MPISLAGRHLAALSGTKIIKVPTERAAVSGSLKEINYLSIACDEAP
jgi:hypothetical protein